MSVIAHILYDEHKAKAYRQEAEYIIYDLTGRTHKDAELAGRGRQYQKAVIAVVRGLTLYDLYHEPAAVPVEKNHPVKAAVPSERSESARNGVWEILQEMGWVERNV